jgi:hypothetical protein
MMIRHRMLRSGIGALGSIPGVMIALGVFAVLVLIRYVCLRVQLNDSPGTVSKGTKATETPMKGRAVMCSIGETVGALGGNVAVGLFLS